MVHDSDERRLNKIDMNRAKKLTNLTTKCGNKTNSLREHIKISPHTTTSMEDFCPLSTNARVFLRLLIDSQTMCL